MNGIPEIKKRNDIKLKGYELKLNELKQTVGSGATNDNAIEVANGHGNVLANGTEAAAENVLADGPVVATESEVADGAEKAGSEVANGHGNELAAEIEVANGDVVAAKNELAAENVLDNGTEAVAENVDASEATPVPVVADGAEKAGSEVVNKGRGDTTKTMEPINNIVNKGRDVINYLRDNNEEKNLTQFSNIKKYIRRADKESIIRNPKSKLSLFVFKLNVDGNFSNVEVLHKLCDTNDQIISGYFFEYNAGNDPVHDEEFFRKLDKKKSTKEEDSTVKSNIDLIYQGLNNNVISCKKAQLSINVDEVYNNVNKPSLTFNDGTYYDNLKIINRHVDVRVDDYELFSENSKLFKAILDYLRNDEITAINFSDKIFPFNKYIEDISTLKVKSVLFTSPEQQSYRGGSTQGKYTKRRKNTKRRRTRNKNKRYM